MALVIAHELARALFLWRVIVSYEEICVIAWQ